MDGLGQEEGQVCNALAKVFLKAFVRAGREIQPNSRKTARKLGDYGRQTIHTERLGDSDRERSLRLITAAYLPVGFLGKINDSRRIGNQALTRVGEHDAPAQTIEKPDTKLALKRLYLSRDARLGIIEPIRRLVEAHELRDSKESPQMSDFHGALTDRCVRLVQSEQIA